MKESALIEYDRKLALRGESRGDFGGESNPLYLARLPNELDDLVAWLLWTPTKSAVKGRTLLRTTAKFIKPEYLQQAARDLKGFEEEAKNAGLWYEFKTTNLPVTHDQRRRFRTFAWLVAANVKAGWLDWCRDRDKKTREEIRSEWAAEDREKERKAREARRPMNRKGKKTRFLPILEYDWLAESHRRAGFKDGTGRSESTIKSFTKSLGVQGEDGVFNYSRQDALQVLGMWLGKAGRKKSTEYAEVIWNQALERGGDGLKELHSALCPSYAQLEPPPPPPPTLADLFPKLGLTPPG